MEKSPIDRSSRVLVAVDSSNFEYVCIFAAVNRWRQLRPDEANLVMGDGEADEQPELLNVDSFRRTLRLVVQDKLEMVRNIVSSNHEADVDLASGVDFVFALDGDLERNFRKELYPDYKAQRTHDRQGFSMKGMRPYIEDVLFRELMLESALGYKLVKVDGCETDDVIATLMRSYPDYMARIVISSDRDFLQLDDVVQYDCWGKKVERVIRDVTEEPVSSRDFLLWKIIRGDVSDNIRNVFPKVGDKKSWKLVQDRPRLRRLLAESNDAMERYTLNRKLIDFGRIPVDCIRRIKAVLDEKLNDVGDGDEFMLESAMVF